MLEMIPAKEMVFASPWLAIDPQHRGRIFALLVKRRPE